MSSDHACEILDEETLTGPDEWTCPDCGRTWERHVRVWYEPKEN